MYGLKVKDEPLRQFTIHSPDGEQKGFITTTGDDQDALAVYASSRGIETRALEGWYADEVIRRSSDG